MEKQKRNTKTKQLVMELFQTNPSLALCHDDIMQQLVGKIDRVTVYRILQGFCDDGAMHKIPDDSGKTYYALCHDCEAGHHNDEHVHFHCIKCNTVKCVAAPEQFPKLPNGYRVADVSCFISGYCPNCK
jgi:Fe2+ or Zn2+ uptake regulation protein